MSSLQKKILLSLIIIIIIQLSCDGGISPQDRRVPIVVNQMAIKFDPFLKGIQIVPINGVQPPIITEVISGTMGTVGKISGLGYPEQPKSIRLYRIQLNGCGNTPQPIVLLAETTTLNRLWNINYQILPSEVVGATQVLNGIESTLSNLMVLSEDKLLSIDYYSEINQSEIDVTNPFTITGSAFPNSCIVMKNEERMDFFSSDKEGKWYKEVQLKPGRNEFEIYPYNWDYLTYKLILYGTVPKMSWPLKGSSMITAFFGKNNYHSRNFRTHFHDGLDIKSEEENNEVFSVADGYVFYIQVDTGNDNGGNTVFIDHGGWFSAYVHLSIIEIKGLDSPKISGYIKNPIEVKRGEKIGIMGNTGCYYYENENKKKCGVHLHFSAARWINGNREITIKKNPNKTLWTLLDYGLFNINPPKNQILQIVNIETQPVEKIVTQPSDDRLMKCVSDIDIWDNLDWSSIKIINIDGTNFSEYGNSDKCAMLR
ncbi:MAG: M23 family metallopeptidase [Chloroflexota bacterium]